MPIELRRDNSLMRFPPGFHFGSATSPYQVEGNISGKRLTDWDAYFAQNPSRQTSLPEEIGPNWWEKGVAEKDLATLAGLGLNAQRIGIEWARVFPKEGVINHEALSRYRELIDAIKANGMEVMLTLNHFTNPQWVAQQGGWENGKTARDFASYSKLIAEKFDDVNYFLTLNEPTHTVAMGYWTAEWPPFKQHQLSGSLKAANNMVLGHKLSYNGIKEINPDAQIGIAHAVTWLYPHDPKSLLDRKFCDLVNFLFNNFLIGATNDYSDFTGINFYHSYNLRFSGKFGLVTFNENAIGVPNSFPFGEVIVPKAFKSDIGWPVMPNAFVEVLTKMHNQFKKPIFITENGVADKSDKLRAYYLLTHLLAVQKSIEQGVDIRGYYYWASISTEEWMKGHKYDFGLISNNPVTGQRTLQTSGGMYGEIARLGAINLPDLKRKYFQNGYQKHLEDFVAVHYPQEFPKAA